jgi:putative drug exporter of the RND superfamily
VLVFWVIVLALTGSLAGKLMGAEKNDASAYLPASAESTQELNLQSKFTAKNLNPAVVVYVRPSGLTPADLRKAAADARLFAALPSVHGRVAGPIPSSDHQAMQTIVGSSLGYNANIEGFINNLRATAARGDPGLTVLLVARYREELRRHEDRHEAMAVALRRAGPAIIASAGTVIAGMLCLLVAESADISGLGPVAAIGIAVGLLAMITLLPALLVITGRWVFWPSRPRYGSDEPTTRGFWARVGRRIAVRPGAVWVTTAVLLACAWLGLIGFKVGPLTNAQSYRGTPASIAAERVLAQHFPGGAGEPVAVIGNASAASQLRAALASTQGIAAVSPPQVKDGLVYLQGTLASQPDSPAAAATVDRARAALHAIPGANAKVGGATAINSDVERYATRDRNVIIPLVLLVVLLILGLLLRAVVAAFLLIGTVVLSFGAALGLSALLFRHVFGFAGADTAMPLFVFVFLVALGIDYNIFLMTRVREESKRHGTRLGAITGLGATGGVITSAGLILAGTFATLSTLPLVILTEIGVTVAIGVLIDTVIVRSVLVTALTLDIGRWMWWPSPLARPSPVEISPQEAAAVTATASR